MSDKKNQPDSVRRGLMTGLGAASIAALAKPDAAGAQTSSSNTSDTVSVAKNGKYETVPLRQSGINISAIQSRVRAVDIKNLKQTMQANMDHVIHLIDIAQGSPEEWGRERLWGGKQDFLCMHEFPIQGFQPWTRKELNQVALELPGPETEAIGQRAKDYDCYISFGCYAREKDWPDHVINMSVIVGPDGNIVSKQWKARNILGLFGDGALIGTTVYDVFDEYVEMYGLDATLPIARTDIGNIAITAVGVEPIIYQCLTLKGAEILVLSVTGGNNPDSASQAARANRIYTVGVGNSVSPDNLGFADAAGSSDEGTVICDPRGTFLARSANHHEDIISTRIPIADFRENRRFREIPAALVLPVLQQYEPKFKPNAFSKRLPATYKEAGDLVRELMGN